MAPLSRGSPAAGAWLLLCSLASLDAFGAPFRSPHPARPLSSSRSLIPSRSLPPVLSLSPSLSPPPFLSRLSAHASVCRASLCMVASEGRRTILTCGKCKATYEVDVDQLGAGTLVRCSNCKHEWFQTAARVHTLPPDMELVPYPAEMKARIEAGKSPEPLARFRIFVGNVAFTATEQDLEDLFSPFGTVVNVRIMTDEETGRSRGFAFVNFESVTAGLRAVEALDGTELNGRTLNVSEGKQSVGRGRGRGGRGGRGNGRGRGDGRGRGPRPF